MLSGGFGGLHALGIFLAIKFKIIVVAAIAAAAWWYYWKLAALKKCDSGLFREGSVFENP